MYLTYVCFCASGFVKSVSSLVGVPEVGTEGAVSVAVCPLRVTATRQRKLSECGRRETAPIFLINIQHIHSVPQKYHTETEVKEIDQQVLFYLYKYSVSYNFVLFSPELLALHSLYSTATKL